MRGGVDVLPPSFRPLVALKNVTMRATWSLGLRGKEQTQDCTSGVFHANEDSYCVIFQFSAEAFCTIYSISLC